MRTEPLDPLELPWESFGEFLGERMRLHRIDPDTVHCQVKMSRSVLRHLLEDAHGELPSPSQLAGQIRSLAPLLGMEEHQLMNHYQYYERRRNQREHSARRRESVRAIGGTMWIGISALGLGAVLLNAILSWSLGASPTPDGAADGAAGPLSREEMLASQLYDQLEQGRLISRPDLMSVRLEAPAVPETEIRVVVDDHAEHHELLDARETRQYRARERVAIRTDRPDELQVFLDGRLIDARPGPDGWIEVERTPATDGADQG